MVNSRKGRPTVKKMPRVAKKYERKAYSIQFKRDVISYWEKTSMEHVIKKFWPDKIDCNGTRTMLYKWKACKEELRSLPLHCNVLKIRPNGASTVLPPEIESYLANWIRSYRSEGVPISNQMVQLRAK